MRIADTIGPGNAPAHIGARTAVRLRIAAFLALPVELVFSIAPLPASATRPPARAADA